MARTIELAPKWRDVVRWIMRVLEDRHVKESVKKPLREELIRLASEMDRINDRLDAEASRPRSLFNRKRRRR